MNATAPAITSTAGTTFTYDAGNSFTVTTSGTSPITLDYQGGLPLGVSFTDNGNGTATISGRVSGTGTYRPIIIASNGFGTATQNFTLTVTPPSGMSAVDGELSVSPSQRLFGVVAIGSCGPAVTFTVRNTGTTPRNLGTLAFGGHDLLEYQFTGNACNNAALAAGTSCAADVAFCPNSTGSKGATLLIPSDDPETPVLAAALHNYESIEEEASRRIPPVLNDLFIPAVMNAGQQYTLTWSMLGYDESYISRVYLFSCNGVTYPACGESSSGRIADSGLLLADSVAPGGASYGSLPSKRFNYSYTFTTPAAGDYVIRFYHKSINDHEAGMQVLSTIIPGRLNPSGTSYYDKEGRRLQFTIAP